MASGMNPFVQYGPVSGGYARGRGPVMPHGSVVTNVQIHPDLISWRKTKYRDTSKVIGVSNEATVHEKQSVEAGDILFKSTDMCVHPAMQSRPLPGILVFAAFDNLPVRSAMETCSVVGVAESRYRPMQGENLDNPVIAACVHGMRELINNSDEIIQAGEVCIAVPPTEGDPAQGSKLDTSHRWGTGLPGKRCMPTLRTLRSVYSVFFNSSVNRIPDLMRAACSGDDSAGLDEKGSFREGLNAKMEEPFGNAASGTCPYMRVQKILPFAIASLHDVFAQNDGVDRLHTAEFDRACIQLTEEGDFLMFMNVLRGFPITKALCIDKLKEARKGFGNLKDKVRDSLFLQTLLIEHMEFVRRFVRRLVVGRAMEQSLPGRSVTMYVNPVISI